MGGSAAPWLHLGWGEGFLVLSVVPPYLFLSLSLSLISIGEAAAAGGPSGLELDGTMYQQRMKKKRRLLVSDGKELAALRNSSVSVNLCRMLASIMNRISE